VFFRWGIPLGHAQRSCRENGKKNSVWKTIPVEGAGKVCVGVVSALQRQHHASQPPPKRNRYSRLPRQRGARWNTGRSRNPHSLLLLEKNPSVKKKRRKENRGKKKSRNSEKNGIERNNVIQLPNKPLTGFFTLRGGEMYNKTSPKKRPKIHFKRGKAERKAGAQKAIFSMRSSSKRGEKKG